MPNSRLPTKRKLNIQLFGLVTLIGVLLLSKTSIASSQAMVLRLAVYEEHVNLIKNLTSWSECAPLDSFDWHDHQGMEFSVICHAFKQSEMDVKFKLVPLPNYHRALREMERGTVDMTAHTLWGRDFNSRYMLYTDPVVDEKDSEKGIYLQSDSRVHGIESEFDIRQFSAVTNLNWNSDVSALECLGVKPIHASGYVEMFHMIDKKRADFVLVHFGNTFDLSRTEKGVTLFPLPGYKISMNDALHFFVNKNSPHAELIQQAVSNGISLLKRDNVIRNAYVGTGYIQERVSDWKRIGCG